MFSHRTERPIPHSGPFRRLRSLFQDQSEGFLLDSGMDAQKLGRFSFLGCRPSALLTARITEQLAANGPRRFEMTWQDHADASGLDLPATRTFQGDPFAALRKFHRTYFPAPGTAHPTFPLTAGLVGYLGYELGHAIEKLPGTASADHDLPDAAFLVADEILAHDHQTGETRLFVTRRARDPREAERLAGQRADEIEALVSNGAVSAAAGDAMGGGPVQATFDRETYMAAVERCREHIHAGDVFEVCLTHRLEVEFPGSPAALYERLQAINPAPFASYLQFPDFAVVSASPERFLRLDANGRAESRPIKGTRPRGATPAEDARLRADLASSEKDRSENVMIVDLVRNDLGKVCETGSVGVPELLAVEEYATVFQLVSTISGQLRSEFDAFDLVRATFPGGSMTGAPKIAAMSIIDAIEPATRGIYSGAIGYFDQSGAMDLSIVIRTAVCQDGRARLGVGGAVVSDSDPGAEYQETLDKARALIEALQVDF